MPPLTEDAPGRTPGDRAPDRQWPLQRNFRGHPGRPSRMRLLLLVPAALLLAACGTSRGSASDASNSPGAAERNLVVQVDRGDGTPVERYTLACGDEARGDHPQPAAACARVLRMEEPFRPLPADSVCTQQYGGPQTARVTGTWQGDPVDLELSRVDGCAISQWDALVPLVPEVGQQPPA